MTCEPIPCPKDASGWPNCVCSESLGGQYELYGAEWIGSCTTCPTGFASSITQSILGVRKSCTAASCPEHSTGHPLCGCKPGYFGSLNWNAWTSRYEGSCRTCSAGTYSNIQGAQICQICPSGTWSNKGASSCDIIIDCPVNSSPRVMNGTEEKSCECRFGTVGFIYFDFTTGRFTGQCDACPPGYTAPTGSCQCHKVYCPDRGEAHPNCMCPSGFEGNIVWNAKTGEYTSRCSECPEGYWSHGRSCVEIPCPQNAARIGTECLCANNTSGLIQWDSRYGVYTGSCAPCPGQGFASNARGSECIPIACPDNAYMFPKCRCLPGYAGVLNWNGTWNGQCTPCSDGTWVEQSSLSSVTCEPVACPSQVAVPVGERGACKCKTGFKGRVYWSRDSGEWKTTCYENGCVPNSRFLHGDSTRCVCNEGFEGVVRVLGTNDFDGICLPCDKGYLPVAGKCKKVECPDFAARWPDCACVQNTVGAMSWSSRTGYEGKCQNCGVGFMSDETTTGCSLVRCPEGSSGHPDCHCIAPHAGHLAWSEDHFSYIGGCVVCSKGFIAANHSCSQVKCPPGTTDWPECRCGDNTVGEVSWAGAGYESRCESCPVGMKSRNGTECEPIAMPQHSHNFARPTCEIGFAGILGWDVSSQSYTGTCTECGVGTWSVNGTLKCEDIPCPSNSSIMATLGEPVCECVNPAATGTYRFANGEWVGSCEVLQQSPQYLQTQSLPLLSPTSTPLVRPTNPLPDGSCLRKQAEATACQVTCVDDGRIGGLFDFKQCCSNECWCVDIEGAEIPESRHDRDGDLVACNGFNCLELVDSRSCVSVLGTKEDLKLTSSHVVEVWVKPQFGPKGTVHMPILGTTSVSSAAFSYGVEIIDGKLHASARVSEFIFLSNQSLGVGEWNHIAFMYDQGDDAKVPTQFIIFVDGIRSFIVNQTASLAGSPNDEVTIGQAQSVYWYFGSIGELRIWDGRIFNKLSNFAEIHQLKYQRTYDAGIHAAYRFVDNGFGQPNILLAAVAKDSALKAPKVLCASPRCTDEPRGEEFIVLLNVMIVKLF
jgi:hypothetical protein